jgi:hypothetical protein
MLNAGLRPVNELVIFLQGCRANLPGKAACNVQYAESMVKLENKNNNKATLRPALHVVPTRVKNQYISW